MASFRADWERMCGGHSLDIRVCAGEMDGRRGFGVTRALINCLDQSEMDGQERAIIFEDDVRLFDAQFCSKGFRAKLWADAPRDGLLYVLYTSQMV